MAWKRLQNKQLQHNLIKRAQVLRGIRDFFDSDGFVEVMTPRMVRLAGQEPYLDPFVTNVTDAQNNSYEARLITSPEYSCKKLLAAGFEKIYDLGSCFRNREAFGGLHNLEFTMLEWYRADADYTTLMDDVDAFLTKFTQLSTSTLDVDSTSSVDCERVSMRELWRRYCDVDLDVLLERESLVRFVTERGIHFSEDDRYEDLFYRVFLKEIEPELIKPTLVYDYPAQMAALAKLKNDKYAERVELYIDGIEIANGFSELIDGEEQKKRLIEEQKLRGELGRDVFDIDEDFIDALSSMKPSAGIALGVDRLIMSLLGTKNIEDVIAFPAQYLFNNMDPGRLRDDNL
ncbi:MAG: EF-P lysine aminoacylase GenX [Parcubacteria group bacterium]|nr:EF-P lysine aminoacylase GenX [Parcubacteria group bacterium]